MCVNYSIPLDCDFEKLHAKIATAILNLEKQFPEIDSGMLWRRIYDIESVFVSAESLPFFHDEKYYRVRIAYNRSAAKDDDYFIERYPSLTK